MQTLSLSLFALTAEDLMSRDVLTLTPWMSVQSAARALTQARIGGAPVVDERGQCVGVFSLADYSRRARSGQGEVPSEPSVPGCVCSDWEVVQEQWQTLPADIVKRYMTPDPVLVPPQTPLGELARLMVDAHIHRLIVAAEDRRPIGIVSSTDVLAAVTRAAREAD